MEACGGPPPPPPPPLGGGGGEAHSVQLPPHLQSMMREVQATLGGEQQDQQLPMHFGKVKGRGSRGYPQPHHNNQSYGGGRGGRGGGGGRGGRGGRDNGFRGHGGGRGGRFTNHRNNSPHVHGPMKRKRDFDGTGVARFFLPSCLEDPWLPLLRSASKPNTYDMQLPFAPMVPPQVPQQHVHPPRTGRVLFQPSFLSDPWAALVR